MWKKATHILFWKLDTSAASLSPDDRLFVIVLIAGGIGAMVHALRSFGAHIGRGQFKRSWTWWYIVRPFEGAAVALTFYFILRGGLLTATVGGASNNGPVNVSVFGVAAFSVLVGLFSQEAVEKLRDLAETLLTKATQVIDSRTGLPRRPKLVATGLSPTSLPKDARDRTITVSGKDFDAASVVRVNDNERKPDSVAATKLTFKLTDADVSAVGSLKVVVFTPSPGGGAAAPLTIEITG